VLGQSHDAIDQPLIMSAFHTSRSVSRFLCGGGDPAQKLKTRMPAPRQEQQERIPDAQLNRPLFGVPNLILTRPALFARSVGIWYGQPPEPFFAGLDTLSQEPCIGRARRFSRV